MVTMKDVAQKANVSVTTVSHVINKKGSISDEVRNNVLKIINELNFRPNKTAQSLARSSTRCIGLFASELQTFRMHIFLNELMTGILSVTSECFYNLIVYPEQKNEEGESCISLDHGEPIDGAIIINPRSDNKYLKNIIEKNIPFVLVGRPNELSHVINYVDVDNVAIGYNATKYLVSHNHTGILFLNGPEDYTISMDRLEGYKIALGESNIPFSMEMVVNSEFNIPSSVQVVKEAIQKGRAFTAIIANSDTQAIGAMNILYELNYIVPKDVSIICTGETLLTTNYHPKITGIDSNAVELGMRAANQLLDILNKKLIKPSHSIVPFTLNERETVIFAKANGKLNS